MKEKIILVCELVQGPLLLPDNRIGRCAECGCKVQFRPHAPKPHIKRCVDCFKMLVEDGDEITTTPRMLEDARAYWKKQQQ